jgi:D-glycero-D-manno-heptose 1,7-bisphosphate phosphatase
MKTIILDRDGVILKERGEYTFRMDDSVVLQENIDVLAQWAEANEVNQFFVLTNQGGIAKELYTMKEVNTIHKLLSKAFELRGIEIKEFFVCPHHQDYGICLCRKPKTLLFEKIVAKYRLNPKDCLMIGDKERDIIPAKTLGMQSLLIESNETIKLGNLF